MLGVRIGTKMIGDDYPTFLIAEVGSNHNQNLSYAKELVDVSAEAGMDAIKFQSFTVEHWISKDLTAFPTLGPCSDIKETLRRCELSYEMYREVSDYANAKGLICFSTPSHITDVEALWEIGVPAFKFGAVQITDIPTIRCAAQKGLPLIVSTGGATLEEIERTVHAIRAAGNEQIVLLHCTVLYPTEFTQVNLRVIETLRKTFNLPVGYSDHSRDPVIVPVMAVALKACVVEKHITLSRNLSGPDHSFALEPRELKRMVEAIRSAEKALGDSEKRPLAEEMENVVLGRRSIVAKKNIPQGAVILPEYLTTKRPGYGIQPAEFDAIVGKIAKVTIEEDRVITWEMICDE